MTKQVLTKESQIIHRVKAIMAAKGIKARTWATKAELDPDLVRNILRGKSASPRTEHLVALAEAVGANPDYLLMRSADMELVAQGISPETVRNGQLPMVGYIGAGSQVFPFGISEAHEIDRIDAPPGMTAGLAAVVRGRSMFPVYRPGDVVVAAPHQGDIENLIGHDCFAQVLDGPLYLKIIKRGKGRLFGLASYNEDETPLIQNQRIDWAAPVGWVKRA